MYGETNLMQSVDLVLYGVLRDMLCNSYSYQKFVKYFNLIMLCIPPNKPGGVQVTLKRVCH